MVSRVPMAMPFAQPAPLPKSKPSKPLLRRSTLSGTIRKYDEAHLESDLPSTPLSPSKRARVTFNPDVEEKVMERWTAPGRTLSSVKQEVKRALKAHERHDSDGYGILKEVFAPRREDEEDEEVGETRDREMGLYLKALSTYASDLNRNCNGLVKVILACEWMGREEDFLKDFVHFLECLCSAQGSYTELVLKMLVEHFAGSKYCGTYLKLPKSNFAIVKPSSGRLPGCPTVNRSQLCSRLHTVLKRIIGIVPSAAANALLPLLTSKFPYADECKKTHTAYVDNLITLLSYAPYLKSDIFALITDRLVKIDVQMQTDLDDVDDDVAGAVVQALSLNPSGLEEDDEEGSDSDDSDAESVDSENSLAGDSKRIKELQENVEKMDAILDRLFTIYTPYFDDPDSPTAIQMFETLLSHFTTIILPTYHSRHTQFLLFHFSQASETLIDQFAGTCVDLAFDSSRPAVFRQSAAAYLASFVARGSRVPAHVVRTVFELIGSHLDKIRHDNDSTCRGPDLKRYTTFYAMTQALLYIFCFRWRDLVESSEILEDDDPAAFIGDLNWIPGIKETMSRTIYSKLNPLKICCPSIVSEFAKIAKHLEFMLIYPLLDQNKRIRLSQFTSDQGRASATGSHDDNWHQLDAYFPFDPYQLPISKRWVEDDYVQWRGIPGLNQEEDEEEEESEEDDDGSEEGSDVGDEHREGTATDDD
jgi:RNA polymerase I-specific transcription initiation factor RRN3